MELDAYKPNTGTVGVFKVNAIFVSKSVTRESIAIPATNSKLQQTPPNHTDYGSKARLIFTCSDCRSPSP